MVKFYEFIKSVNKNINCNNLKFLVVNQTTTTDKSKFTTKLNEHKISSSPTHMSLVVGPYSNLKQL